MVYDRFIRIAESRRNLTSKQPWFPHIHGHLLDLAILGDQIQGKNSSNPNESVVNHRLEYKGHTLFGTCVSMGNPHCVIFVPEITDELVLGIGPLIEKDDRFPKRTNVEFVEILARGEVRQRTWERGSGETWACGTGASAVCVAGVLTERTDRTILNHLTGGDLILRWDESTNHVFMTGPAVEVFQGKVKIDFA